MKPLGPLFKLTLALVALCSTLVMLADLFFGLMPDRAAQTLALRKNVAEAVAVQVAALLEGDDQRALQRTLAGVAARTQGVLSLGVRRADGVLVMQAGDHAKTWRNVDADRSQPDQLSMALHSGDQRWGTFEIAFKGTPGNGVPQWLTEPVVIMLLFLSTAGTLAFGLYMRRALQHLDPASVIPERVQGAFDAMAEGVVVLDVRGRVLLANKAFRALHADAGALRLGHSLSILPWLASALPEDGSTHPWARAMVERTANAGHTLELSDEGNGTRRLVVNCAPVTDTSGRVRGCLTTFSDVSELHRSNQTLRVTLAELSAAKDQVQLKNEELKRLATRDPMTGCLNRRAFNEEFEPMFQSARARATPLSFVMLDIDHFKRVNDNFGHAVGDRVILEVAKKLQDASRTGDLVCRYGGEEFCVVVPGLDLAQAMAFAERVRVKVERECAAALRDIEGLRVTISLGVDVLTAQVPSPSVLIDRADQGLYRAKRTGRNRVCAFEPGSSAAEPVSSPHRDPLTGCLNRRGLDLALEAALRDGRSSDSTVACLVLGVDKMKAIHDAHGSAAGDRMLQQMGRELLRLASSNDAVARCGTEEFALLSPGLSLAELNAFAQRLLVQLPAAATAGIPGTQGLRVTLSAGVDALPAASSGAPTLLDRADRARLRARRAGGNQVCLFASDHGGGVAPGFEVLPS